MGDLDTGLYVASSVIPLYRSLLSLATIITPNQFEAELLSQMPIRSLKTLYHALKVLHVDHAVKNVSVSSALMKKKEIGLLGLPGAPKQYTRLLGDDDDDERRSKRGEERRKLPRTNTTDTDDEDSLVLVCFASTIHSSSDDDAKTQDGPVAPNQIETYAFLLPTIEGYFSGVGDLFSALVLGFYEAPWAIDDDDNDDASKASGQMNNSTREEEQEDDDHGNGNGNENANSISAFASASTAAATAVINGLSNSHEATAQSRDARSTRLPPFAHTVSQALLGVQNVLLRTSQHARRRPTEGRRQSENEKKAKERGDTGVTTVNSATGTSKQEQKQRQGQQQTQHSDPTTRTEPSSDGDDDDSNDSSDSSDSYLFTSDSEEAEAESDANADAENILSTVPPSTSTAPSSHDADGSPPPPPPPAAPAPAPAPTRLARRMRTRELRIVQDREDWLGPLLDRGKAGGGKAGGGARDGDGAGWPGKRIDWESVLNDGEASES